MYQKGDPLWIPAGTLLRRSRVLGTDDLFSNYHQTTKPCVALFIGHESHDNCTIMLDGRDWSVETRQVRHNVAEEKYASQIG